MSLNYPEDRQEAEDALTQLKPGTVRFLKLWQNFTEAEDALDWAKNNIPDYTAQWEREDYYRDELDKRNRAANDLAEFMGFDSRGNGDATGV